jgi:N-acetylmuramoyl-L-alanine amidase
VDEPQREEIRDSVSRAGIGCILGQLRLGLLAVLIATIVLSVVSLRQTASPSAQNTPGLARSGTPTVLPGNATARATATRRAALTTKGTAGPTSMAMRVGLLAGHSGPQGDPGAVCPDGLREADINLSVARKVRAALEAKGYLVDLLEEFDEELAGYSADAFLAIHADSCDTPQASGFKVAHVSVSAIPDIEDVLVDCLYTEYGRASGLPRHDFSITPDMHEYHAFLQIAPETPGAIIELGFLAADRYILTRQQDKLASGIVAGLLCFLQQ